MCTLMKELGVAVDGGKDSLSMAAKVCNLNESMLILKSQIMFLMFDYQYPTCTPKPKYMFISLTVTLSKGWFRHSEGPWRACDLSVRIVY